MYTKRIYISGGSFYELQAVFKLLPGVIRVTAGYINPHGDYSNISYEAVKNASIHSIFGVEVEFNPKRTDLSSLLDILFAVADPYSESVQGPYEGPMYRCGVYYQHGEDLPQLGLHFSFAANRGRPPAICGDEMVINDPNSKAELRRPLKARLEKMNTFIPAEEEHQDYLMKHPDENTWVDINRFKELLRLE